MRGKTYIAIFLLAGIIIATAVALQPDAEPSFHRHQLGWWVDMYGNSYPDQHNPEDVEALTTIGTNALPYLIKWIRDGGSGNRAMSAAVTFSVLGTNATPAIPDLKAILANPPNDYACVAAARALTRIGPEGFAAVLDVIAIPGLSGRGVLMQGDMLAPYLARPDEMLPGQTNPNYKINGKRAAPVLLQCLADTNVVVRHWTLTLLSISDPDSMVPALANYLQGSPPPAIRRRATDALAAYGRQARDAVPFLLSRCTNSDPSICLEATNALMEIAPEALPHGLPQ